MKAEEIEKLFHQLKEDLEAGAITEDELLAKTRDLLFRDDRGRYWTIGASTGQWYRYDEADWVQASPPQTLEPVGVEVRPPDTQSARPRQRRERVPGVRTLVALASAFSLVCLVVVALVSFELGRLSVMTSPAERSPTPTVEMMQTTPTAEAIVPTPGASGAASPTPRQGSPTPLPTGTHDEGSRAARTTPTVASQPSATPVAAAQTQYGPPVLRLPENGMERGPRYRAILEWEPVGELASGEYYHVTVCWNNCQDFWGGFVDTTSIEFPSFHRGLARDDLFHWWVVVRLQRGDTWAGNSDPPISPPSETWVFRFPEE